MHNSKRPSFRTYILTASIPLIAIMIIILGFGFYRNHSSVSPTKSVDYAQIYSPNHTLLASGYTSSIVRFDEYLRIIIDGTQYDVSYDNVIITRQIA